MSFKPLKEICWLNTEILPSLMNTESIENRLTSHAYRSKFDEDYGTILYLSEFRNLGDKTQVYSTSKGSNRNRLTHSLEVFNIALQLWRNFYFSVISDSGKKNTLIKVDSKAKFKDKIIRLNAIEKLLESCCLAHDIGHPPFAHTGEKLLAKSLKTKRIFDSNVQNLRILTPLSINGKNNKIKLSCALLDSLLKNKPNGPFRTDSFSSRESEIISYLSEKNCSYIEINEYDSLSDKIKVSKELNQLVKNNVDTGKIYIRHPITYFMVAADDISYISSDIEDALNEKTLKKNDLIDLMRESEFELLDKNLKPENKDLNTLTSNEISNSKIKTYILRYLLSNTINNFLGIFKEKNLIKCICSKKNHSRVDALDFLNSLPKILLFYSLLKHTKETEFGNLLYKNKTISQFKKKLYNDNILKSPRVIKDNHHALSVINKLVDHLIPSSLEETNNIIPYLPENYQSILLKLKDEKKIDEIKDHIVDYIASLRDQEAEVKINDLPPFNPLTKVS